MKTKKTSRRLVKFSLTLLLISLFQFSFGNERFVPGAYFVKFQHDFNLLLGKPQKPYAKHIEVVNSIFEGQQIKEIRFPFENLPNSDLNYVVFVQLEEELDDTDFQKIKDLNTVDYIEKVPEYEYYVTPNDFNKKQWYLNNINAKTAWDYSTGNSSVLVAVIDDAIAINHEDLKTNIWTNSKETPGNGIDDDNNGYVDDVHGFDVADYDGDPSPPSNNLSGFSHGSHVSGLIAAATNNNKGIASIGYNVQILPIKASKNASTPGYLQNAFDGIVYAMVNGAQVINMSWGGYAYSYTYESLVELAQNSGIICVAAAGNGGTNIPMYPASYKNVIGVGATDSKDEIANFSNYGSSIDFMAPGVGIYSTVSNSNSSYANKSGTSMSAPLVSGLVALIKSEAPAMKLKDVYDVLSLTAQPVKNLYKPKLNGVGNGIIDAGAALKSVAGLYADFTTNKSGICPGSTVNFYSTSRGKPTSYKWIFEGGSPSSSTSPAPQVYYSASGTFDVTLIVNDGVEVDTLFIENYISSGKPTAEISGGGVFNAGATVLMNVKLTGTAPWSIVVTDNKNNSFTINGIVDSNYYFTAQPNDSIIYNVSQVSDLNCFGSTSGSAAFDQLVSKDACITIQPGASQGKDAMINSAVPTANLYKIKDYAGWTWNMGGGVISKGRGFIDFDLSTMPKGAKITSAKLSLYYSNSSNAGQTGSNATVLRRITQKWSETGVTWNNQPNTSALNQVTLATSSSSNQDYPDIDVTDLMKDMLNYPDSSYGLMIRSKVEKTQKSMKFFSSDGPFSSEWPKLVICYTVGGGSTTTPKCSPPIADFEINSNCLADTVMFTNKSTDTSGSNLIYSHWSFGDGNTTTGMEKVYHKFTKNDTFNVQLVVFNDQGAGCADTIIKQIVVDNNPSIFGLDTIQICKYDSTKVSFRLDCVAEPYTVSWNNSQWVSDASSIDPNLSPPYSTTFTVTLKDNFGKTVKKSIYIDVDANCCQSHSNFILDKKLVCLGDKIEIGNRSVSSKGKTEYFWNFSKWADRSVFNGTNPPKITFQKTGFHPIKLILVDDCGIDSITEYVAVMNKPVIDLTKDTVYCKGQDTLNLSVEDVSTYSYDWSPKNILLSSNLANTQVIPTDTVTINLKVTDRESGCSSISKTRIKSIANTPKVNLGLDTTLCSGSSLTLFVSQKDVDYKWSTGDSAQAINVTKGGLYSVEITNGCGSNADTINIVEKGKPTVEIIGEEEVCDSTITLVAKGDYLDYIEWNNEFKGKRLKVNSTGVYWVKTKNICGEASAIHVVDTCEGTYIDTRNAEESIYAFIPNAFSPNNDGLNDEFSFSISQHFDFEINIYNSLGILVYRSNDANESWDGYFGSRIVAEGNYHFRISMITEKGANPVFLNGTISVLK